MQVLIVTADVLTRDKLQSFFTKRRHTVESFEDCRQADARVDEVAFQFALLDLAQSEKSVLDLCRRLRALRGSEIHIMAMPKGETPEALRAALEAGIDDYLLKPVTVEALQLRLAIGQRRMVTHRHAVRGDRRYRTLIETMNEGLFQVNDQGIIEFANSRLSKITGYTLDELIGESADELLVDPMVRERLPGGTLLGSGTGSEEYSIPLRTRDGESVWVNLVAAPLPSPDGASDSIGVVEDITEQRNAEEALRFREEYFRALLENASDLITIVDLDGRILYQSLSSQRLLGIAPEDMVGRRLAGLLHPDDERRLTVALDEALAKPGATASAQLRFRRESDENPDEPWLHLEALLNNLVDNSVVGGVVVNSRDVTERRRFEIAIRQQKELFQQLFSNSPDGIVILDEEDLVVDANDAFLGLFRYELDELRGQCLGALIVPEALEQEAQEMSQLVAEKQTTKRETTRKRKDGSEVDVLVLHYPTHIGAFGIYSDITERKHAERELFHSASHDQLTGLPNRANFQERLEIGLKRARRRTDYAFAVLFIDLDGFKAVNDGLGHNAGDELLIQVAKRLQNCLRPGDTTARLGGDEFTLIVEDIKESLDAIRVAERVLQALTKPFDLEGHEARISGSIGVAFSSSGYETIEDLMRDADIAMYRAKARGKACYEIFDSRMVQDDGDRLALEGELEQAIADGQLLLHYQPVISLDEGKTVGFEALVRWHHPERGLIRPRILMPMAEETGLIIAMGRWVLQEACRQVAEWQASFPTHEGLLVSVNLSLAELGQSELLRTLDDIVRSTGVHAGQIAMEIPERHLVGMSDRLRNTLWQIHQRGFRLYVDEVGVGDTSLRALHKLPFELLKVGGRLVTEMPPGGENIEMLRATAALGDSLGIGVVAQSVEASEQRESIENLGLRLAQGFLFSKPLTAEEATQFIADDPRF